MNGEKGRRRLLCAAIVFLILAACLGAVCVFYLGTKPKQAPAAPETEASPAYNKTVLSLATSADWGRTLRGSIVQDNLGRLEQRSGGTVKILLYDRNQMGEDLRILNGVQIGTVDLVDSMPSAQVTVVPEAALLDIPGLFDSVEQFNWFMEQYYFDTMQAYYNDAGLQLLSVYAYTYRHLSAIGPVENGADLAGLRIRTVENQYQEEFWKQLGAVPVPYSFSELYFVLHQGIVDAQENTAEVLLSEKLMDVQDYVVLTRHLPMVSVLVMNLDRYNQLDQQAKENLQQFADEMKTDMVAKTPDNDQTTLETLQNDYGMQVIHPEPTFADELLVASQAVMRLLRENLGDEKVDDFLEAVRQAKQDML